MLQAPAQGMQGCKTATWHRRLHQLLQVQVQAQLRRQRAGQMHRVQRLRLQMVQVHPGEHTRRRVLRAARRHMHQAQRVQGSQRVVLGGTHQPQRAQGKRLGILDQEHSSAAAPLQRSLEAAFQGRQAFLAAEPCFRILASGHQLRLAVGSNSLRALARGH